MALSLLFFGLNRYSILFVENILSYFSKFKMLVGMSFLFCRYNFIVPKPRLKIKQSYKNKVVSHLWAHRHAKSGACL